MLSAEDGLTGARAAVLNVEKVIHLKRIFRRVDDDSRLIPERHIAGYRLKRWR